MQGSPPFKLARFRFEMTPIAVSPTRFILAMGAPPDANISPWVQFLPIALMAAIFYFIILMPARRRQKKVQDFLASLKVGDRVITTGGIYGTITKLTDRSVQIQIADKVRIEVSRASIGGYQGQPPVAEPAAQ